MNDTITILQVQTRVPARKEETLVILERCCLAASERGADLLALGEMFCCPYATGNFPLYAEEEGGPLWTRCSELAAEHGIWLSAGTMPERGTDGKIYNTAYVFDRWGQQAAKHRKMHLFDIDVKGGQSFRESATLTPGSDVTVFDTEFGPIGLCVCYDIRFPELGRLMALKGARLILCPAAFNQTTGPAHWELLFRSQAMFNQVFAVGTAPALDKEASYHSWGHSIVTGPWGDVIGQMETGEGEKLTRLDLAETERIREQLPLLRHRRTDVYTLEENR
jgi:predicted amidohydrolase